MRLLQELGVCDSHSHVYGPFARFPLSRQRTFDPLESPIEDLETLWRSMGIDRAVLIQGGAHGNDHRALLAALARSPRTRRGVAVLNHDVTDADLADLHHQGIRAVRFNWIRRFLDNDLFPEQQRLARAATLLNRINALGWHAEIHIDIADLDVVTRLSVPAGMPIVIDHMARIDASGVDLDSQVGRLQTLLERDSFWVKLSGADRLTENCDDLKAAADCMRRLLTVAPDRCIWGLDWPHVNLVRKRNDLELAELLVNVAGDEETLQRVLIHNPAKLYGFELETASHETDLRRNE